MAVEPMRTNPGKREHFGYVDGTSQPWRTRRRASPTGPTKCRAASCCWATPRCAKQYPCPRRPTPCSTTAPSSSCASCANGRPARRPGRARAARLGLDREVVYAKLMGRERDGKPLAATGHSHNDFNFRADADGRQCPIHAHIRRANPRQFSADTGLKNVMPRIMRRGMSYGALPPAWPTRTRNAASCSWPTAPTRPSSSRSSSAGWPAPTQRRLRRPA